MSPYSKLLKPAPCLKWFLGRNMFQRPILFASALRSSIMEGCPFHLRSPSPSWAWYTVSAGTHRFSTNSATCLQRQTLDHLDGKDEPTHHIESFLSLIADEGFRNSWDLGRCGQLRLLCGDRNCRHVEGEYVSIVRCGKPCMLRRYAVTARFKAATLYKS